jgi:hypothetical protein
MFVPGGARSAASDLCTLKSGSRQASRDRLPSSFGRFGTTAPEGVGDLAHLTGALTGR